MFENEAIFKYKYRGGLKGEETAGTPSLVSVS